MTQNISRRNLLKSAAAIPIASALAGCTKPCAQKSTKESIDKVRWAFKVHLGINSYDDRIAGDKFLRGYRPYLRFNEKLFDQMLVELNKQKADTLVIEVANAVKLDSHPEIAVKDAWSHEKLKRQLKAIRSAGLEPIPALNFSTLHDSWLGKYQRMVSTEKYYQVCQDVIAEIAHLFDTPTYFHLGMDEETTAWRHRHDFLVFRQHDLWWHDINFYFKQVQKAGSTPWVWSDYIWRGDQKDLFEKNMPKSVLQSNWYYGNFGPDIHKRNKTYIQAYQTLEDLKYDQFPCGSAFDSDQNFPQTVQHCKKIIHPKRLKGFLMAPWHFTFGTEKQYLIKCIKILGQSKTLYYNT
jgi:hypothetical protein